MRQDVPLAKQLLPFVTSDDCVFNGKPCRSLEQLVRIPAEPQMSTHDTRQTAKHRRPAVTVTTLIFHPAPVDVIFFLTLVALKIILQPAASS